MQEEKKFELGAIQVISVRKFNKAVGMFVDLAVKTDMGVITSCGWRVGISGRTDKPYIFNPQAPEIETEGRNKGKVKRKKGRNGKTYDVTSDVSYFVDTDALEMVDYPFQAKATNGKGITPKFYRFLLDLLEQEFGGNNEDDATQSDDDTIPMDA